MKVTICELSDNELQFIEDWSKLKIHLKTYKPDLLLLPEMPFCKWIASEKEVTEAAKKQSVNKHERWLKEIEQLKVTYTVYSKPVINADKLFNTAYVYERGVGHHKLHTKCFFPEEDHFWEETWFNADPDKIFEILEIGGINIGVLLCTEMWFTEYARQYGKQGIDILLCPRATGLGSVTQWLRCAQTLSVISGAYCLSSNRSGYGDNNFQWGGNGWITKPGTGNLSGVTSADEKFITQQIDISKSRKAKTEYPLYVGG
ncbi:carbon-nitrogen hydrolase family protein [Mucilaginibacter sp. dw_454]|uniref:carbon-nitrogen hydrolase family protein n=1 Tax=Mucilaginibacter sp. dw_454 TaxID=2720079 RepID=UPI001BD38217|nr:carbon-nitrogen hydrolase family protein [Mucilaginibacter sp. dw_454]